MKSRKQQNDRHFLGSSDAGMIPIDLIIEILWRLPAKSIARCRCVSKLWATIVRRPDFTELFLTKSSARPRLLFAYQNPGVLSFFSTPQYENSSANYHHMNFHCDHLHGISSSPISGLVCFTDKRMLKGRKTPEKVRVICNPSTGQSFTLPKMMTRHRSNLVRSFFMYDPVDKQFKVLAMTLQFGTISLVSTEHQVLTLGTDKLSWRMIECGIIPHYPDSDGICINGVFYYEAYVEMDIIVCFDVRSEKFSFIKAGKRVVHQPRTTLINYNGKLGLLLYLEENCICRTSRRFEMQVLEDPGKQEWSKHFFELPLSLNAILYFVGMTTDTNEIVLSPSEYPSGRFYVFYCSIEKKTIRRVEIQGLEAFKGKEVNIFLNHVEDVKLMKAF